MPKSICVRCQKRDVCESVKSSPVFFRLVCPDYVLDEHAIVSYALFVRNCKNKHTLLLGMFDLELLAISALDRAKHNPIYSKKKYSLFIVPCTFTLRKSYLNDDLIQSCYNIANCLELAERALLKNKFDLAEFWFEKAKIRSGYASLLLHDIL